MWELLPSTSSPNSKTKSQEGKALKESSKETVPGGRGRVPVSRGRWCAGRSCHPSPRAPAAAYQSRSPCPLCAEGTGRAQGDLAVVLDDHVDDVHRLAGLLLSGIQVFRHQLVHCLLTGVDQVEQVLAALEPFWPMLDSLISVQHKTKCGGGRPTHDICSHVLGQVL